MLWTEEPGGYSPQGHKESDRTEWLTHIISKGQIKSPDPLIPPDNRTAFLPPSRPDPPGIVRDPQGCFLSPPWNQPGFLASWRENKRMSSVGLSIPFFVALVALMVLLLKQAIQGLSWILPCSEFSLTEVNSTLYRPLEHTHTHMHRHSCLL